VISLSIDRSSIGLLPLTIGTTRTTGAYMLMAGGWNPGTIERDNTYARSRWLSGASLVSTRDELTSLDLGVRIWGSSLSNMRQMVDDLGAALGQFSYQITETWSGNLTPRVYDCCPASYAVEADPDQWRQYTTIVTASIPRQP
jgi:hypothetical protein